jgi:peroxin-2
MRVNPSLAEFRTAMRFAAKHNVGSPILRVNQLDAIVLDNELFDMLKMQFLKIFTFFREDFVDRWKPELEALLRILIFEISIGRRGFSYGQQLQNLTFTSLFRTKKILFLILSVAVPYLLQRWFVVYQTWIKYFRNEDPPDSPEPATLRRIHSIEKLYQLLSTINFLVFLWNGSYVSLLHRILGIQQNYLKRQMARHVGFEYMNRQLIWNGFTEFMLFIMPMIPVTRIARTAKWIGNAVFNRFRIQSSSSSSSVLQNDSICPICSSFINIPYQTNCGHKFCYYCLKVATMSESKPPCNVCGTSISTIQRFQPNSLG